MTFLVSREEVSRGMPRPRPLLLFLLTALTTLVVGCGSSHHDVASGGGNSPAPSTATIRVQQVLARAVPSVVTQQRFTGFDARGEAHFGPVLQDKAATVELKDVPLTVTLLQIEYLQGSTVVGIASIPSP